MANVGYFVYDELPLQCSRLDSVFSVDHLSDLSTFCCISCRWQIWVVGWLVGGSGLITATLAHNLNACGVQREKVEHLEQKGNTHWGLKRGGKLFGFGLNNPFICDFRIFFFFLSHTRGATYTHTVEINRALQTTWFWGNNCTKLDNLFFKYRDIEQLL